MAELPAPSPTFSAQPCPAQGPAIGKAISSACGAQLHRSDPDHASPSSQISPPVHLGAYLPRKHRARATEAATGRRGSGTAGNGVPHHHPGTSRRPQAHLQLTLRAELPAEDETELCSSSSTPAMASGHPAPGEPGIPCDTPREKRSGRAPGREEAPGRGRQVPASLSPLGPAGASRGSRRDRKSVV